MANPCDSLEVDLSRVDLDVTWETQPCIDVEVEQTEITIQAGTVANQGPIGPPGPPGSVGDQGDTGPPGPQGLPGAAATVAAGATVTTAPGTNAAVTNSGSSSAAVFDFAIPRGAVGATGPDGIPGVAGPTGPTGPSGLPAHTLSTASFTVPSIGSTVVVQVADTSWVALGEIVYVQDANGIGVAGAFQVTAKTSTSLTLLNVAVSSGSGTGDMTKAVYDVNADNVVDHATLADVAPWTGITGKPSTFPPDATAELIARKAQINGYASLDGSGKVPSAQLPSLAPSAHGATHVSTDLIPSFNRTTVGLTPASGGTAPANSNFLCEDGSWDIPTGLNYYSSMWTWTTKTADANTAGQVGVNTTAFATVTQVNLNEITTDNRDLTISFGVLFVPGNQIYLQHKTDGTRWARYLITAAGTDHGNWWSFPVTYQASSGAFPTGSNPIALTVFVNGAGISAGDMLKSVYDTNSDNIVDKAAALSTAGAAKQFWKNGNVWAQPDYTDLTGVPSTFTPSAHALDTHAACTDITTLNASSSAHGLLIKVSGTATDFVGGDNACHAHSTVPLDTLGATTDITTRNASTTAHGLLPKLSNVATQYLNGAGAWTALPATSLSAFIETPANKTYTLEVDAPSAYTIVKISIKTISGTCTAALQRNGAAITGATAISVSSTIATVTLSQACVAGDIIALVISSNSSAADLSVTVRLQP